MVGKSILTLVRNSFKLRTYIQVAVTAIAEKREQVDVKGLVDRDEEGHEMPRTNAMLISSVLSCNQKRRRAALGERRRFSWGWHHFRK